MAKRGILVGDRGRGHRGGWAGRLFERQTQRAEREHSAAAPVGNKVVIDGRPRT